MNRLQRESSLRAAVHRIAWSCIVVGLLASSVSASRGEGVVWANLTLDEALTQAARTGQLIMINVHSAHCGSCGQLDSDVWETKEGAELAEGLIPVNIDNAAQEGNALQARYPVTGLPAVIFIRPDGKEVDRVVGYAKGKQAFLAEALPLKDGVERLPAMEEEFAAHPDSLPLILPILERRLNRFQDKDAGALVERIMRLDPANRAMQVERALSLMTRYYNYVRPNPQETERYWRILLDQYPTASSAGAAVNELYKLMSERGEAQQWKEYMCSVVEKQPQNGRLLAYIAYTAHRAGMTDPRLAQAARTARQQGQGRADLDSIAVVLEGKKVPPASGKPAGK